jgi:hypothetical protein
MNIVMAAQEDMMSNAQSPEDLDHVKKLLELKRAKELAEAEKAKLEAEKGRLEAQKALDAQKSRGADDELKVKTAAATSEKQLAEAEKARIDAQRALEQAKRPADPAAEALHVKQARAKAEKEFADAQKAAADAEKAGADASKAKSEAEVAAFKAQFGEIPISPYKGEISLKENAGKTEALLLAAHAVRSVAAAIVTEIQSRPVEVMLVSPADVPSFDSLIRFRAEVGIIQKAFDATDGVSQDAMHKEPADAAGQPGIVKPARVPRKEKAVPLVAAAGLAVEAADRFLGFFKSDYTVGGIDVTLEDAMLINELAGLLTEKKFTVYLPKLFNARELVESGTGVVAELEDLALRREDIASTAIVHERLSTAWTERAMHEAEDEKKKRMRAAAEAHQYAAKALLNSITLYDSWFARLSSSDEKLAAVTIIAVIREQAIMNALNRGRSLLVAHLHASGGSYYTKKNIWTVFGGMPFFHMGGTVASFALIDGKTGAVAKAGTVPVHGGFIKATKLANEIVTRPGPPQHKRPWWARAFSDPDATP